MIIDLGSSAVFALFAAVIALGAGRDVKHVIFAASAAAVLSLSSLALFPILGQVATGAWIHAGWLWLSLFSGIGLLIAGVIGGARPWRALMILAAVGSLALTCMAGVPLLAAAFDGVGYMEAQIHADRLSPIFFAQQAILIAAAVVEIGRLRIITPHARNAGST